MPQWEWRHGYECSNALTGILGNGEYACEFSSLISNWTRDLTVLTNGPSTLTTEQTKKIEMHGIRIAEKEVRLLQHSGRHVQNVVFKDGQSMPLQAIYARPMFEQHCQIPASLGCEIENGYLKTDISQMTTVPGVYACGDNAGRVHTLASTVSTGTIAGMMVNKELTLERF